MKKIRQKAILELVSNHPIASQEELLEGLQSRKIEVSQSTLSRDIQELRLAKTGGVYTVMDHEPARPSSEESVKRILREFLLDVLVAQNLVVLKTGSGHASSVSQAVDEARWPEVVGTLAGENTVFLATQSLRHSQKIQARIREILA